MALKHMAKNWGNDSCKFCRDALHKWATGSLPPAIIIIIIIACAIFVCSVAVYERCVSECKRESKAE